MAAKPSIQQPIDRPLSRAYLREFSGWSTAYPPGLSDPTSLRVMENVYITREGAARVRPGIRSIFTEDLWLGTSGETIVGSFEHFIFDDTGVVALLFAVRNSINEVVFKVFKYNDATDRFDSVSPSPFPDVKFSSGTTYVRYIQIDNKILALSNDAGEPAILFNVGTVKTAKKISADGLSIPAWTDAPIVVHPDAAWIDTAPKVTRPSAETPTPQTLIRSWPGLGAAGTVTTASGQPFTLASHGLTVNQQIVLKGTTAPTGFTLNNVYYVREIPTKDQVKLSSTLGGAVVNPTSTGTALYFEYGPKGDGATYDDPNVFNFGIFYTFETEFGESAPSGITLLKTARGWSQWLFNSPDANGNPETTVVIDPTMAMDQLVGMLPVGQYDAAKLAGAIKWNLYQFTWNPTSPVPSVATLVGSKKITAAGTEATESWIINSAAAIADAYLVPVPNVENRVNYSGGPRARQGIAVGDRLVLVNDGVNQALIRWSANVPEEFTNFSPTKGGGQKTLSSGNLLVPLSVHLWQNPQSTDTIVIVCKGLNGYHAAYYMAPASVAGQSDSTLIMGFEETTATPGTVSPYGNEVFNNKLYHTLEAELMASSAANYSISHKTLTTDIANKWQALAKKEDIVSSQHDGRLYFIVNNPDGDPLEDDCMGNEIWVIDVGTDTPTWSRWKVQGISLHKLQIGDKLYMAVTRPDAIFILDDMMFADEYAEGADTLIKNIPWKLETNTLGANKQHDAWAYLDQASIHVGDFLGSIEWGIRGYDVNNYEVKKKNKRTHSKQNDTGVVMDHGRISGNVDLGDTWDQLKIERDMMEWTFYAQSIEKDGVTQMSYGQLDYVQFMITQMSTNVGYERGSVETFEYRRDAQRGPSGTGPTRNGVPMPLDLRRP